MKKIYIFLSLFLLNFVSFAQMFYFYPVWNADEDASPSEKISFFAHTNNDESVADTFSSAGEAIEEYVFPYLYVFMGVGLFIFVFYLVYKCLRLYADLKR